MTETVVTLTTIDNPFDPIDQFSEWYDFDMLHGYGTWEYVMRIAHPVDSMTPEEEAQEMESAIDRILELDFEGIYKKIKKEVEIEDEILGEEN